jgi:hypothetical protein
MHTNIYKTIYYTSTKNNIDIRYLLKINGWSKKDVIIKD